MKWVMATSAVYLSLIVTCAVLLAVKGLDRLEPVYILNIGVDLSGMSMAYVLFICCIMDVQKTGSNLKYFLYLINAVYFGLFTDACAWLVNFEPSLRILNILDNTLYYMCAPVAACFFWLYTMTYLRIDRRIVKMLGRIVQVGLVITLILIVLNIFGGFYFTVDEAGVYSREKYYIISTFYGFLTMLSALVAIYAERKQLERYQIITLFSYAIAPIALSVITVMVYGLSISYGVIMLVLLLMYCLLNVSQGREKAVADRDLALAANIQAHILPKEFPYLPERQEFDLHASMKPAKEVGGDFYDFFMVDDDHIGLVIADVSGKGVPASLFMMAAKGLIKNRLRDGDSPKEALSNVNEQLLDGNGAEMFVTVWLAVIELSTGHGVAVNAGHEHPAYLRAGSEFVLIQYKHSPAVATLDNIEFREREFDMRPGDVLFVYTDGVVEATNDYDRLFGTERMLDALNKDIDAAPEIIISNVMDSITSFVRGAEQFDDITMLCLKYHGKD